MCKSNKFCCCNCSLKTGVMVIVILDLVAAILSLLVAVATSFAREDS